MHTSLLALLLAAAGPAVASPGEPYDLPPGSTVVALADGPDGTAVAFYVEPFPGELYCAVGIEEVWDELRRAAAFDADGRLLWRARVRGLREVSQARVRDDLTVEVLAVHVKRQAPARVGRFRVGGFGIEALP